MTTAVSILLQEEIVIHFLEFQACKYLLHTISVEEGLG